LRQRQHRADPLGRATRPCTNDVAVSLAPSFGECEVATRLAGARLEEVRLVHAGNGAGFSCDEPAIRAALDARRPRLCWLCSPNNPTGAALPAALIAAFVAGFPDTLFVLDEACCDLLPEPQCQADLLATGNLLVLHSMTKYWGLAGLRLGHAVAEPCLAAALRAAAPPWSVNACAQAAGLAALADLEHHRRAVAPLTGERDRLVAGLRARGWVTEPSTAGLLSHPRRRCPRRAARPLGARLPGARLHVVQAARARAREPASPRPERPPPRGVRRADPASLTTPRRRRAADPGVPAAPSGLAASSRPRAAPDRLSPSTIGSPS